MGRTPRVRGLFPRITRYTRERHEVKRPGYSCGRPAAVFARNHGTPSEKWSRFDSTKHPTGRTISACLSLVQA
jgi:hypothetical protein